MYYMSPIIYLKAFQSIIMDTYKGEDLNMIVLIDSSKLKMTDLFVADHN